MSILTVIINHNCNENAISLKVRFNKLCDVYLIDSGSKISDVERPHFDRILGNVFYVGMLNEVVRLKTGNYKWILIVASDVRVSHVSELIERIKEIESSDFGIYAPSVPSYGSTHPQMRNKTNRGFIKAPFVDGFCFAVRPEILSSVFPIDTSLNKIGWGVDVYLAYHCYLRGHGCVVDHKIIVDHRVGPNNMSNPLPYLSAARLERTKMYLYLDRLPGNGYFRFIRRMMFFQFLKGSLGAKLVSFLLQ